MLKVPRYYSRLLLCLFISLSVIFSSVTVEAFSETSILNYYWDVDIYGEMGYNASDNMLPIEFEEVNGGKYAYYYRIFNKSFMFTTSHEYYAYKVLMRTEVGCEFNENSFIMMAAPVVGSYTDIVNGTAEIGDTSFFQTVTDKYSGKYHFFWLITDHAEEDIWAAVMLRLRAFESSTGVMQDPFVDYLAEIPINVWAYTLDDYQHEMSQSLQEQNRISQDQLEEAQLQTQLQEDMKSELESQTQLQEDMKSELEEQTESQKSFFGSFFDNLKNLVLGIFVPSADEMADLFDRLNEFFSEKFGFLYYPFEILVQFVDMVSTSTSDVTITLPGFTIMGHTVWESQTYNFGRVTLLQQIGQYVKVGTGSIIVFAFINYLRNFFEKRFGGGGS